MVSRYILRAAYFVTLLVATAAPSFAACPAPNASDLRQVSESFAPRPPPVPEAYAWFELGVKAAQAGRFDCVQTDFVAALAGFRRQLQAPDLPADLRFNTSGDITASFSFVGVARSKLGNRKAAAHAWQQAIESFNGRYAQTDTVALGDKLFTRKKFRQAFIQYRNDVFPSSYHGQSVLNMVEVDAGVPAIIRRGLAAAISGRFSEAATVFAKSPPSQAAYYLEGQAASAAGEYSLAYSAYVNALLAWLKIPSTSSTKWIEGYSYPAWVRLADLSSRM